MRYRQILLLLFASFAVPIASGGPVYKCQGPTGKMIFSDRPCAPNAEQIEVNAQEIGGSFAPSEEWNALQELDDAKREQRATTRRYEEAQAQLAKAPCRDFNSSQLRTLIIRKQVVPGMTHSDALRAWGSPSNGGGWQNAYHWQNGSSSFFYVENGCVSKVQGTFMGK